MSRLNIKTATLDEIENECAELVGTQFGHNMIGIICESINATNNDDPHSITIIRCRNTGYQVCDSNQPLCLSFG